MQAGRNPVCMMLALCGGGCRVRRALRTGLVIAIAWAATAQAQRADPSPAARGENPWRDHPWWLAGMAALAVAQTVTIGALFVQRARRLRAERDVRANEMAL